MHGVVVCEVCLAGTRYLARLDMPSRLHIPLCFDTAPAQQTAAPKSTPTGAPPADAATAMPAPSSATGCAQPNHFGAPRAEARPLEGGGFTGDTRRGGSCNAMTLHLTPHCNGTHTEGIGHLTRERRDIDALLEDTLIPATLVSVRAQSARRANDTAWHALDPDDQLITADALRAALAHRPALPGLIVRTWPNHPDKRSRCYEGPSPAPFFSVEAARYVRDLGVRHLLVDLPSLDRAHDDGLLGAHRTFWGMAPGEDRPADGRADCTITEMIYVDDATADGLYLLNLQIAPFQTDASPSRVIVYPLEFP